MFIAVQFPIVDIRGFLDYDTCKLKSPSLPHVDNYRNEFLRCFGPIRNRYNTNDLNHDETVYSRANRALRMPDLGIYKLGRKQGGFIPTCVYRRFFANDQTCKAEIGFKNVKANKIYNSSFHYKEFLNLLMELLEVSTLIPPLHENQKYSKLMNTGEKLSSLYMHATTKYPLPQDIQLEKYWVQAGNPMILVEYYNSEIKELPKGIKKVEAYKDFGINLSHLVIFSQNSNTKIGVWLVGKEKSTSRDDVRKLRLILQRSNAERECLRLVIKSIEQGFINPNGEATDNLQHYLNSSIQNIKRKKLFGLPQDGIVEVANSFENIINQSEYEYLLSRLDKIRGNIKRNILDYTLPRQITAQQVVICEKINTLTGPKHIFSKGEVKELGGDTVTSISVSLGNVETFNGNIIIASTIQNSFNVANNYRAQNREEENFKEKLKELNTLIAKLCEELSEDESKQVASDLETFTKEATSKKPRRKWYELSAEGLLEAVKVCSMLIEPVTKAIKEIIAFLNTSI